MFSYKRSSLPLSVTIEGNDDLLMEILLFLPTKSLVSFRAVSKRWGSLISDPLFRRRHTLHPLRRSEAQPLFFVRSVQLNYIVFNPTVPKSLPFSFAIKSRNMQILHSCNGLLLLRCTRGKEGNSYYSYHVFNPTTMERRDLPLLPSRNSSVSGVYIYLLFDPSLSLHYRVICFLRAEMWRHTAIYLYDFETRKWKLGGERRARVPRFSHGVYFNGRICFVRDSSCWSHLLESDDNVTEIPNPPVHSALNRRSSWSRFVESNGVLFGLTYRSKGRSNLLYVSEMKEEEGGWSEKRCVDLNPILASRRAVEPYEICILGVIRGEKEEDLLLLLGLNGEIMMYKFNDEVFEVDDDTSREFFLNWDSVYEAHRFIASLAPV